MPTLYLIIGIPGAGKTTKAKEIIANSQRPIKHYEADMYFEKNGVYKFNPMRLGFAHKWCQFMTENSMQQKEDVIVSNTSLTPKERKPYLDLAKKYGYKVEVITCNGNYQNIHGVPEASLEKMRTKYIPFTKEELN